MRTHEARLSLLQLLLLSPFNRALSVLGDLHFDVFLMGNVLRV